MKSLKEKRIFLRIGAAELAIFIMENQNYFEKVDEMEIDSLITCEPGVGGDFRKK